MKNLLIIHLESLNYYNYKLNSNLFPYITSLENNSLVFDKYFSSATSTLMVLGDITYGDLRQFESCKKIKEAPVTCLIDKSILDKAKYNGMEPKVVVHANVKNVNQESFNRVAGNDIHVDLIDSYEDYLLYLEDVISKDQFFLWTCDFSCHIDFNKILKLNSTQNEEDYWSHGYRTLDSRVCFIFELLKKYNKLDDTTVILYGDHGDDYWSHGMHMGYTHAIEPNALLTHVPLLIWNSDKNNKGICHKVLDTVFLHDVIEDIMLESNNLGGLISQSKGYAFSRNEFAAQEIRAESFNKGYSVTNGKYMLLATSAGLEMFDICMDQGCYNNLLKNYYFFDGYLYFKNNSFGGHWDGFWDDIEIRLVKQSFYFLYSKLKEETSNLYNSANISLERMNAEIGFDKIKY